MPVEEKTTESLSASHTEAILDTREVIRDILKELCVEAYENPYRGKEWEDAVDRTIEKLEPYLKGEVNIPEKGR